MTGQDLKSGSQAPPEVGSLSAELLILHVVL